MTTLNACVEHDPETQPSLLNARGRGPYLNPP